MNEEVVNWNRLAWGTGLRSMKVTRRRRTEVDFKHSQTTPGHL